MSHRQLPSDISDIAGTMIGDGHTVYMSGCTALDLLLRKSAGYVIDITTTASIIELASFISDLRFSGAEGIDAFCMTEDHMIIFHVIEDTVLSAYPIRLMNLFYDVGRGIFLDPYDMYYTIQSRTIEKGELFLYDPEDWRGICDHAVLQARYGFISSEQSNLPESSRSPESSAYQFMVLVRVLEGDHPSAGLKMLLESGFIELHWPLLHAMLGVEQDKDFHPEGDVWDHTLEMFNYVKGNDLDLRIALLLHDCGKAFSEEQNNNRFDRHAQIGAAKARRFLKSLGYPESHIDIVAYLIKNHMIPAYAPKLPIYRIEQTLSSPMYPLLLELFRCDISSSYRAMDIYYDACKHYKKFLRYTKNPYRETDGTRKRTSR